MFRRSLLILYCVILTPLAHATRSQNPLVFDTAAYTTVHIMIDGIPTEVRRYYVVYVAKPLDVDLTKPPSLGPPPGGPGGAPVGVPGPMGGDMSRAPNGGPRGMTPVTDAHAYQSMYIYVPAASYTNNTSAIILRVGNAGWVASAAQDDVREGGKFVSTSDTDNVGAALKAGYIVVNAGTRSRNLRAKGGDWGGKAPAVVVDAKAAIRYLRFNDAIMPGSAERIVITGTSGGGGLSVAVSASGNSPDYYPYLAEIGAAGIDARLRSTIRDDVFATIAYCPINDLGNADLAYEWQFNAVRTTANINGGRYTPDVQAASAGLAAQFPAFLTGLRLSRQDGSSLDAAALRQAIVGLVRESVEDAIKRGQSIPALGEDFTVAPMGPPGMAGNGPRMIHNNWLTVRNGEIRNIDYEEFLRFVATTTSLKTVPAFDPTANTGNKGRLGESSLFGSNKVDYSNYTRYSWDHNEVRGDGSGADDTGRNWNSYIAGPGAELARQIKMTSPIPYLKGSATVAPYWYVRHGLIDRDTSFATQTTLYYAIRNNPRVKDVNFKLPWLKGHSGNYDVQEAYAWLADLLRSADAPKTRIR